MSGHASYGERIAGQTWPIAVRQRWREHGSCPLRERRMAVADALGEGPFGSLISDFGRLVEGMATGQVRPATTEEVVAAVATARDSEERVTIRASAHSFGGQAVSGQVTGPRRDPARRGPGRGRYGVVRPGATVRQVVDATLPYGLLPVLEV